MLSIERCKEILGLTATNLTEEEVATLRDLLYSITNLALANLTNPKIQNENDTSAGV